ncbi:hypothetical protein J3E71DRAFT_390661 [Bipolaris maydis]|nr:hypothetical protein J3E71DRAFT_390661 [Bipolaris maydis]
MVIPTSKPFDPLVDVDSLEGKHILITGVLIGTSGLGRSSLFALAFHQPANIYFTGRNRDSANNIIKTLGQMYPDVNAEFIPTDHSRMSSMRQALQKILEGPFSRLDILMCNAGTMACPPTRTMEGYDIQFATNYMSHALAVNMLLPTMIKTQAEYNSDVRIVLLTSEAYMLHPLGGIDWENIKTNTKSKPLIRPSIDRFLPWGGEWMRYAQSQLANMLLALELSRRYPQIRSIAVMPASISDTNLIRTRSLANRMLIHAVEPVRSPEFGAMTQIWAAGSRKYELTNGGYYQAVGVEGWHVRKSRDVVLGARLWNWTATELGLKDS